MFASEQIMKTNPEDHRSVPVSRSRPLLSLIGRLRVSNDLPAGDGVAHVGGAPAAARPRQEAKAVRVEKTGTRSGLLSGIIAKYRAGLLTIPGRGRCHQTEMKPVI